MGPACLTLSMSGDVRASAADDGSWAAAIGGPAQDVPRGSGESAVGCTMGKLCTRATGVGAPNDEDSG